MRKQYSKASICKRYHYSWIQWKYILLLILTFRKIIKALLNNVPPGKESTALSFPECTSQTNGKCRQREQNSRVTGSLQNCGGWWSVKCMKLYVIPIICGLIFWHCIQLFQKKLTPLNWCYPVTLLLCFPSLVEVVLIS